MCIFPVKNSVTKQDCTGRQTAVIYIIKRCSGSFTVHLQTHFRADSQNRLKEVRCIMPKFNILVVFLFLFFSVKATL